MSAPSEYQITAADLAKLFERSRDATVPVYISNFAKLTVGLPALTDVQFANQLFLELYPKISDQQSFTNQQEELRAQLSHFLSMVRLGEVTPTQPFLKQMSDLYSRNKPRPLSSFMTDAQISSMLDEPILGDKVLPDIVTPITAIREKTRKEMKKTLIEKLRNCKLSPLGVDDLKLEINRNFRRAQVAPGALVGMESSEAITQGNQQDVLKSFHVAGSQRNAAHGIERFTELAGAAKQNKNPVTVIRYKNRLMTYDDVLESRKYIVDINVGRLLDSRSPSIVDRIDAIEPKYWHSVYLSLFGKPRPLGSFMLRLFFNVKELIMYGVTLQQIVNILEQPPQNQALMAIPGPEHLGIIDVFTVSDKYMGTLSKLDIKLGPDPNETLDDQCALQSYRDDRNSQAFLSMVVSQNLSSFRIKGVPGIERLFPISSPILQIAIDESLTENDIWTLDLNEGLMYKTGVKVYNLIYLAGICGIEYVDHADSYVQFRMPKPSKFMPDALKGLVVSESVKSRLAWTVTFSQEIDPADLFRFKIVKQNKNVFDLEWPTSPMALIRKIVNDDEVEENEYEEAQKLAGNKLFRRPSTIVSRAANYWWAEADGENLTGLSAIDEIDPTLTYSNNCVSMASELGIEAGRNSIIEEFLQLMSRNYIDPRQIAFIADYKTNLGHIVGISKKGSMEHEADALSQASTADVIASITQPAIMGIQQEVSSVSASLMLGKRMIAGTGLPVVKIDTELEKQLLDELVTSGKKIDVDDFMSAFTNTDTDIVNDAMAINDIETSDATYSDLGPKLTANAVPKMHTAVFDITQNTPLTNDNINVPIGPLALPLMSQLKIAPVPQITIAEPESVSGIVDLTIEKYDPVTQRNYFVKQEVQSVLPPNVTRIPVIGTTVARDLPVALVNYTTSLREFYIRLMQIQLAQIPETPIPETTTSVPSDYENLLDI